MNLFKQSCVTLAVFGGIVFVSDAANAWTLSATTLAQLISDLPGAAAHALR